MQNTVTFTVGNCTVAVPPDQRQATQKKFATETRKWLSTIAAEVARENKQSLDRWRRNVGVTQTDMVKNRYDFAIESQDLEGPLVIHTVASYYMENGVLHRYSGVYSQRRCYDYRQIHHVTVSTRLSDYWLFVLDQSATGYTRAKQSATYMAMRVACLERTTT